MFTISIVIIVYWASASSGTTTAAGVGIALDMVCAMNVSTYNTATGISNATVNVIAKDMEPLEAAWSWAMAYSTAEGIAIDECRAAAHIQESNTFEAKASVSVTGDAVANYPHFCGFGFAGAVDAFFDVVRGKVDFNYNDMPGKLIGSSEGPVGFSDLGLMAVGIFGSVDARFNWWGDATGPEPIGDGQGVADCLKGRVEYEPWLYVEHEKCLKDHMGRFGFAIPLHSCWNTFSTPIALADSVNHWGDLVDFSSLVYTEAFWWDPTANEGDGGWAQVLDADAVEPLNGMYIKMPADGNILLLTSMNDRLPTRDLAPGWNLIGPNPVFYDSCVSVDTAVSSIIGEEGNGYAFVMSPQVGGQESWVWSGNEPYVPTMTSGYAYWVWMNNADTLAGFGFTPVRDLYPTDHCC